MLKVENVTKQFNDASGSLHVLKDLSLVVPLKRVVSLVGPTACGKTTVLRIIAGLEAPTRGRVVFDEELLVNHNRIGIIFQQPTLLPWRTIYENVRLPLELTGADRGASEQEIREVIASVGLNSFEHYRPFRMSGGMQARTALARELVQHPAILLLDEPLASIDEITRSAMYALLIRLFAQYETSAVWVTHSILEASILSDTVVVLSDRPAVVVGTVDVSMPKEERLMDPDHHELVTTRAQIRRLLEIGSKRLSGSWEEKV